MLPVLQQGGANKNDSVTGGTLNAGSAILPPLTPDEMIIGGEVLQRRKNGCVF